MTVLYTISTQILQIIHDSRSGIVDKKEKYTLNVNSKNVAARAYIRKGNVIATEHCRPC